ncbi:hypothetical protein D8674_012768 [Pyrus ussuriensis x Pyrus communis]|uniref:Uncharacterized protein n=1 Tax=Pyrus ussuriensis x Pyrus communis TaxID=2448454 RepID=A0A5N5GMY3_9ROSA|nr:hypothetical protein D8674_012768 [Pyrus ussuriensis x Pyrus communis]
MPEEVKNTMRNQLSTNYNFNDINEDMLVYLNRLFSEHYKQWKSDMRRYFEMFDDSQVALEEDNWVWVCGHFQEPHYVVRF